MAMVKTHPKGIYTIPDNSLQFNNRKAAQGYLDWIFPIIEKNNYKHLYEVVEV